MGVGIDPAHFLESALPGLLLPAHVELGLDRMVRQSRRGKRHKANRGQPQNSSRHGPYSPNQTYSPSKSSISYMRYSAGPPGPLSGPSSSVNWRNLQHF